ncbi:MAG: hypothetical protein AB7I49_05750 [Candidatus Nitrosocosmicus sp.]
MLTSNYPVIHAITTVTSTSGRIFLYSIAAAILTINLSLDFAQVNQGVA